MQTKYAYFLLLTLMVSAFYNFGYGQRTVGLLLYDSTKSYYGYTLFSPLKSTKTYLIDMNGILVHSWTSSYKPGQSVKLLPDGSLLRPAFVESGNPFTQGGVGGRVERFDWSGNLSWYFEHYSTTYCTHHDIEYMPNGNILMIAWEKKTLTEAVALGRDTSKATYTEVWSEKIIEVKPNSTNGGTIVWEWHIWDHLIQDYDTSKSNYGIVSQHPELYDINFGDKKNDWLHMNAIRYNPARDEIMVSVHAISEFWIIDHSTTTASAASHTGGNRGKGGDLLYRWGNPLAYKLGTKTDQKLFSQHDARWIEDGLSGSGDIMIFNNGTNRPSGAYSSIEQITPPYNADSSYYRAANTAFGPTTTTWTYPATGDTGFYAVNISGATRQPNGNTLICEGPKGHFFEVTSTGTKVWEYKNPVGTAGIYTQGQLPSGNEVFKIYRYAPDFSGFTGKTLTGTTTIEINPAVVESESSISKGYSLSQNYPNPFNPTTKISYRLVSSSNVVLKVYDILGTEVQTLVNEMQSKGEHEVIFNGSNLSSGVYFYALRAGSNFTVRKMILAK